MGGLAGSGAWLSDMMSPAPHLKSKSPLSLKNMRGFPKFNHRKQPVRREESEVGDVLRLLVLQGRVDQRRLRCRSLPGLQDLLPRLLLLGSLWRNVSQVKCKISRFDHHRRALLLLHAGNNADWMGGGHASIECRLCCVGVDNKATVL